MNGENKGDGFLLKEKHKLYIIKVMLLLILLSACNIKNDNGILAVNYKEKETSNRINMPSWMLDTAPIELDWYIHETWYQKKWDSKRTLFDRAVTETTGVNINIIVPTSSGDEKLLAMAVSGELPDIMTISNWNNIRERMVQAGYFAPMNILAEKYAPELLDFVPDSMIKWHTQKDGNWYGISNFFTDPKWIKKGGFLENANGIIARADIMDKLGILPSDFNTQEGAIEALKKVQKANITYNGMDIIPFYLQWNYWLLSRMWGIPWEDENGNWVDYMVHPKFLEICKFLNRLWREGLIQEDNFTTWAGEKIRQGIVFCYLGNLDDIVDPLTEIFRADPELLYVPVGPIHASDGAQPLFDQAGTGWTSTYITKNADHADRAVRLLAFLLSDEGQMLTWYGVEGQTYTMKDGKVQYTNEYLDMKKNDPVMAEKVYGIDSFWPLKQHMFFHNTVDKDALPKEKQKYMTLVEYFSQFAVNTPETMGVWPPPDGKEAGIRRVIDEYWEKQIRKMVLAESEAEVADIYEESISYIYKLGYESVYEVSNKVYKEQKKKMHENIIK